VKILVIGGTGFIGPHLVRALAQMGHPVSVFHRGISHLDLPAEQILGDRQDLVRLRLKADVVIDLILSSGVQAQSVMDAFRGTARRVVAASSIDVYRACGVLHGSEEAYLEPVPLTEESPLRTKLQTYPPAQLKMLQGIFGWVDNEYDKIPVERVILGDSELPGTVLRLPMIYSGARSRTQPGICGPVFSQSDPEQEAQYQRRREKAVFHLGLAYCEGGGVKQSYPKALAWLSKANKDDDFPDARAAIEMIRSDADRKPSGARPSKAKRAV